MLYSLLKILPTTITFLVFFCASCKQCNTVTKDPNTSSEKGNLTFFSKQATSISIFSDNLDTFRIEGAYSLNGKTITLPNEKVLVISENGIIRNGKIVGDSTRLIVKAKTLKMENIELSGTWKIDSIYSSWFDFSNDPYNNSRNLTNIITLTTDLESNYVEIGQGCIKGVISKDNTSLLPLKSDTELVLNGIIELAPNAFQHYSVISIANKNNVKILGNGVVKGDVANHISTEGEWGFGISIRDSKDISISGLTITECWGDCIYIGQIQKLSGNYPENVLIENVTCDKGRRQGLSIIAGKNILIKNSKFTNTGKPKYTNPACGIDVEPNIKDAVLDNIIIDKCYFSGNRNFDLQFYALNNKSSITIKNCNFPNGVGLIKNAYGVKFINCRIDKLIDRDNYIAVTKFINCILKRGIL